MELTGKIDIPPRIENWIQSKLSIEVLLWFLSLALFLIAWNRGLALLYGLFSFTVSALILSYWGVYRQLAELDVQVDPAAPAHCGETFEITFHVKSARRRQFLVFSLMQSHAFQTSEAAAITQLKGHYTGKLKLVANKRGCHSLRQLEVSCVYPFGLVKRHRRISIPAVEVLIYPRVPIVRSINEIFTLHGDESGSLHQHNFYGSNDVSTLREYRQGDEMRHIHWRKSARMNEWVVKEFDATQSPCIHMILNPALDVMPDAKYDPREHMIEIVAALAWLAKTNGFQLTIQLSDDQTYVVEPWQHDLQPLWYQLARWNPNANQFLTSHLSQHKGSLIRFISSRDSLPIIAAGSFQNMIVFRFKVDSYPDAVVNPLVKRDHQNNMTVLDVENGCKFKELLS